MQGDIFQLETLVAVSRPKPTATPSKPAHDTQVSIYNEDDLSHMLYFNSEPHHHHHRHHNHHHVHAQALYTHPADAGTVLINTVLDDMDTTTPSLSDCESCSGFETETDGEGAVTPPLSTFEVINGGALNAYRRKGRRNAMSFEEGFEFPVFLGRQDEEPCDPEPQIQPQVTLAHSSLRMASLAEAPQKPEVNILATHHAKDISGPAMAWWPEPLETMEYNWDIENMQWELQLEREKLVARERECGIVDATNDEKTCEKKYDPEPVEHIDGPLMSWWPAPLYDWTDCFYE
ncbi:hypothetical protein F5B17DRAFT_408594 [Nemania serpens]|nr:hypothetical protein F5B17DRAFT_408594 [Nemania serpens]